MRINYSSFINHHLFFYSLKCLETVLTGLDENSQAISEFELKLAQFSDLPNDADLLKDVKMIYYEFHNILLIFILIKNHFNKYRFTKTCFVCKPLSASNKSSWTNSTMMQITADVLSTDPVLLFRTLPYLAVENMPIWNVWIVN